LTSAAGPVLVPLKATAAAEVKAPARVAVSTPTASVGAQPRPAASASATARFYVVKAGDTLFAIAQRFNTAVDTLRGLNKLSASATIHPGLKLRLP
jgi:LysM repeat protein